MFLDKLYDSTTFIAMRKQVDATAMRQKVISHNLANVDTPHFKRIEVRFEDAFKMALEKNPTRIPGWSTDNQHIPINPKQDLRDVVPEMWRQNDTFSRADDNNVDLDVEMAHLAKNQMLHDAIMERMSATFKGISKAISSK